MTRDAIRGTLIGGLLGVLLGFVGPSLYALGAFGFSIVAESIQEGEATLGFWESFFFAGVYMVVAFRLATVALCGVSGVLVGLLASIISVRSRYSSAVAALVCCVAAVIPVIVILGRPLSPYPSTNIIFFYLPSVLFVGTMGLIGGFVHRQVAARISRRSTPTSRT